MDGRDSRIDMDSATAAELIAFWNSTPTAEAYKTFIPYLAKNRDILEDDHPCQQLIDRWDPEAEVVRPCEVCGGDGFDHEDWCPHVIDWSGFE